MIFIRHLVDTRTVAARVVAGAAGVPAGDAADAIAADLVRAAGVAALAAVIRIGLQLGAAAVAADIAGNAIVAADAAVVPVGLRVGALAETALLAVGAGVVTATAMVVVGLDVGDAGPAHTAAPHFTDEGTSRLPIARPRAVHVAGTAMMRIRQDVVDADFAADGVWRLAGRAGPAVATLG